MARTAIKAAIAAIALTGASLTAHANVFTQASYTASTTFTDHNPSTTMTLAWDGSKYYTASGGGTGSPYSEYDAAGNFIAQNHPGIDFRSVFTDGSGDLLARGYAGRTIYKQNSFGSFSTLTTLNGGSLDAQSAVVLNGSDTEYLAQSGGTVDTWDLSGNFTGAFTLAGFGGAQGAYPQGRGIAAVGNEILTYYNQTLTAWSLSGQNLGSTTLVGAGTGFDSGFSYSYANNKFWVVDGAGGTWRGYDVGLSGAVVPEPGSVAIMGIGLVGLLALRKKQAK